LRFLALEHVGPWKPAVAGAVALAGRFVPGGRGHRLRKIAERLRLPYPASYLSGVALTRADMASALLGDATRAHADHYGALARAAHDVRGLDALDRCVAIDFASYLPDDILVKLDRMAMASSLEGRSPLLQHDLVEFAVRLPRALRVHRGRGKHLLRRVAARWLPREVLEKRKQGFGVPLAEWFRGPLRTLASDLVASRSFRERGLIDPRAAEQHLAAHVAGEADHGELLWLVLSLELWAKRFLDAPVAQAAA
jgi:asparagine synthase (glutamine-hydrolysing)